MRQMKGASSATIALGMLILCGLTSSSAAARESGIQGTPDGKRILVNKDVSTSRYAIAQNQEDRSATGNVFFTDDRPPAFLFCAPQGGNDFSCAVADPCPSSGRESGIQRRPDGKGVLVSKDVAGSRYAITANQDDGSLTGNVFFTDGRPPVFLFCQALCNNAYSCSGADRCTETTCAPYTFLANVTLPEDFFTVPAGCPSFQEVGTVTLPGDFFGVPSATRGPLAVGARQVVSANPFGQVTTVGNLSAASRRMPRSRAVSMASTSRSETFECIGGGTRNFVCEVRSSEGGGFDTLSSLEANDCTFPENDGGVRVENGFIYTAVPDFADCDPLPFLGGVEQFEQRDALVLDTVDAEGFLVDRAIESNTRIVAFGAECKNSAGTTWTDETVRDLTGDIETVLFDDEGFEFHIFDDFQHVDQTILYSPAPECAPTYDLTAGSITTTDGLTGEVFTTTYGREGGLQFSLEDSVLLIDGGLTSECSGVQSSFTFRTIQAPLFDQFDPTACPRDGRVEVSSNGTVIGQIVFLVDGGLQLVEADGRVTTFPTCNDAGLLLRCG